MGRFRAAAMVLLLSSMPIVAADSYLTNSGSWSPVLNKQLVQQHTVFHEIVRENTADASNETFTDYAAVVGLVLVCKKRVDKILDNAVLWFNDQFLFGEKNYTAGEYNDTSFERLGMQDPDAERFPDCYVPQGFAVLGNGDYTKTELTDALDADQSCSGCVFQYNESFYITDPNNVRWIIDRYDFNTTDDIGGDKDLKAWFVHNQVDLDTYPYSDEAPWRWEDSGTIRPGAPRFEQGSDEDPGACPVGNTDVRCSLQYDFLLIADFDELKANHNPYSGSAHGANDESKQGNSHPNNPTGAGNATDDCNPDDPATEPPGGHHCANDQGEALNETSSHRHPETNVDIFIVKQGPFDLENARAYWGNRGEPTSDCKDAGNPVFSGRTWKICDVVDVSGFHLHDGSQTIERGGSLN